MGVPTTSWSDRLTLPPHPAQVAVARGFVRHVLLEHDLQRLVEDVRLVASELVTYAVRRARIPFTVVLEGLEDTVRLTVSDDSVLRPTQSDAQPMAIAGMGLIVVKGLSRDWGVEPGQGNAKSVWASFALHADDDARRVVRQGRPRSLQEPLTAGKGSSPPLALRLLPRLLRDVKEARVDLQAVRAKGSPEAVRDAHAHLVAALTLYVEALGSRRLPVPYLLRDELRLYGRTSAVLNASRWGG